MTNVVPGRWGASAHAVRRPVAHPPGGGRHHVPAPTACTGCGYPQLTASYAASTVDERSAIVALTLTVPASNASWREPNAW